MLTRVLKQRSLYRAPAIQRFFGSDMGMGGGGMGHAANNTQGDLDLWETENRAGMLVTIDDTPGKLANVLGIMGKYNIDLT